MVQGYNNRSLFSDYYLEERLGDDPHWQTLRKSAGEHRQRITDILEKAIPGINGDTPEAEVERRLIRPILDALGHIYFVQPAVPSAEGVRRPDYAFFPSPEARQEAEAHKGKLEFFKTVLAVGDAKAWERSLDKRLKGPGDPFTNHNPSYQIDFYLRATNKRWGLLTNGRHWRLYHRDLSYRLDVYYEVDLLQVLTLDGDAFLYFLAFFHKAAFQPDGTGECFLDRAYRASTEYATRVSEELQDNVYEALRLLAEGFLSFPGNSLKSQDLNLIRENAFIVIYRLLFTLYAEAREFLPVTSPIYWGTYSLRALTREIAAKEPFEANLHPAATGYWSRLQDLFRLINNGDDFLHIPPYNGRLFDDQKEHQCLATWKIGDRYLAGAIDQLARARAAGRTGRGFVSYKDLSIRELGSIYEGLLQHRPRYATQDMAVVMEDKRERFVPLVELGNRKALNTYRAGSVYLETDKGERKATGSYYTPQYIVEYIVKNTLGPLLEEAKKSSGNIIDAILSLKVLDPAMGSGHFLVEATDYLARALVEALGGDSKEMEEDEIRWARREVVERCIYGADLNPLAVDLAKLSLWLSTVSLDKPLNFLDHHLRCGNSLIGAWVKELGMLPEPGKKAKPTAGTTLAGHQFATSVAAAVNSFHHIMEAPSTTIEDIHRKENAYRTARYALLRIKEIADIWTSVYFGNQFNDKDGYERLLLLAESGMGEWPKPGEVPWAEKARQLAELKRFFHWELEFPEVFFDRYGNRLPNSGFSAVVGNPPWVRVSGIDDVEDNFLRQHFETLFGHFDLYVAFIQLGVDLLRKRGCFGMITPNKYLVKRYANQLRPYLLDHCLIMQLTDVSKIRVFADAASYPLISVFERSTDGNDNNEVSVMIVPEDSTLESFATFDNVGLKTGTKLCRYSIRQGEFRLNEYSTFDVLMEPAEKILTTKIEGVSVLLRQQAQLLAGTPAIDKFYEWDDLLFNEYELSERVLAEGQYLRFIVAGSVRPYCIDWDIPLRAVKKSLIRPYLSFHHEVIGDRKWRVFKMNKIVIRGNDKRLTAAFDDMPYANLSLYAVIFHEDHDNLNKTMFLLALLNSNLLTMWYRKKFGASNISGGYMTFNAVYLEQLPIRRIGFNTPKAERERLVEEGREFYQEYIQSKDWRKVLSFVGERLPRKPGGSPDTEREQSDVVHYLLAFLAEEMTRLHKEKQAEIKGFLNWLENYLGISVENLKNKTKVKDYWKAEVGWDSFLGALEQNRKAIQSAKDIDVTRREPQETIRAEFDSSVAKLKPVLERIELTDKLIDQIVYRLYGLTDAEIAVVEGSVGMQNMAPASALTGNPS